MNVTRWRSGRSGTARLEVPEFSLCRSRAGFRTTGAQRVTIGGLPISAVCFEPGPSLEVSPTPIEQGGLLRGARADEP